MKRQRIIIADGNSYFREGLRRILQNMASVEIAGEAGNGDDLLNILERRKADIVFLDIVLPGCVPYDIIRQGCRRYPGTRFIVFTSLENPRYLEKMVEAGASGYLLKSVDNHDLLHEILRRGGREFYLSPGMQHQRLHFEGQARSMNEHFTH